jgi:hypothetical protein
MLKIQLHIQTLYHAEADGVLELSRKALTAVGAYEKGLG